MELKTYIAETLVIVNVNTLRQYMINKLFIIRYLTTHISNDILMICYTKRKWKSQNIGVLGVGMYGYHALIKSQVYVPVAIAHIGISRGSEETSQNKKFNMKEAFRYG